MILNSLKARLRNNFNVSIAEVGFITSEKRRIDQTKSKLFMFVGKLKDVNLIQEEMEIL